MSPDGESSNRPSPGEICWVEIPVTDISRAVAFYRAVLDWQTEDAKPAASVITPGPLPGIDVVHFFSKGLRLNGAFVKVSDDSSLARVAGPANIHKRPRLAYYMVESIDETLGKVESAGGRVHVPKTAISGGSMGFFARFVDSEGNLQAIWSGQAKELTEH
ncbi:hypothetical protein B0H66DRAFT_389820 [Apodospora peruviana]|uniref:VOC domain-containing protein n=1 Tax=Apodospora peruviana TaxID=516989 RepID=A0AAE0HU64_9PEZI|nr:hypothetical protein B0H66DRAFT_389820 [Apodospora peruviana]